MQGKLYLLFLLLSIFVICSISVEQKPRIGDSLLDYQKKLGDNDRDDKRRKMKQGKGDEDYDEFEDLVDNANDRGRRPSTSSYADSRYNAFNSDDGNYRTRSRWQGQSPLSLSSASSSPLSQLSQLSPLSLSSYSQPQSNLYDDYYPDESDWVRPERLNVFPSSLPSVSYESNPLLSNGPQCSSLVDPQYPIFSDVCGAVPQARYSLPNVFGHRERWQAAQVLSSLLSSLTEASCTRSLRLLLCPVLFPPCQTRYEPPSVLPCQSYCRAIKARCSNPALDLLPCEALPVTSDLCPTNQAYGSFLLPTSYPASSQPSPMSAGLPQPNFPVSRSQSSLQSFLSSQGLQSPLAPSSHPSGMSPSSLPSAQSAAAAFSLFNNGPYATDSLPSMFGDYSAQSLNNDYRQAQRYSPLTRSSTEARPVNDVRSQTGTYAQPDARYQNVQRSSPYPSNIPSNVPSGVPSLVKA